ncbi:MAG: arabinose efflux permease family protein [Chitinophagaceae bacterium]|nr:arabinose efflux permease family protein [Chitinophagaceae bacterium]
MKPKQKLFTRYQVFVIAILAILQFTVILDFMVLSPLGAILLDSLHIHTAQFGLVVSAYAFSAGLAGLLTAGFADKYDRKKLLLFFYTGFLLGTVLCAVANTYNFLLMARIITGLFAGVIGSVSFAIITDMFVMEVRGRVMGFVQMAFAASQVLGLPIGLVLANRFGWHSPFYMIAIFGLIVGVIIVIYLKPVIAHLALKQEQNAFKHLVRTLSNTEYLRAFAATIFIFSSAFLLMPFGSTFTIRNLGMTLAQLPIIYGITGVASIIIGPIAGKLADKIGKYKLFVIGSCITILMIIFYTRLGITPLWEIVVINIIMFAGITARMISASALLSAVPAAKDRGAFMSINASVQQVSGGIASMIAGMIIMEGANGKLERYPLLGYVAIASMITALILLYALNKFVAAKLHRAAATV